MEQLFVIKKNGEHELYSEDKVIHSMTRVGVPADLQPEVLNHLRSKFRGQFITTDEVFKHLLEFLEPRDKTSTIRLSLRQAIYSLGPTGFPFEKYLARIFQHHGYRTNVDQHLEGDCVIHEVDLVLERDNKREIMEVKFHNEGGVKTDVQVALYTYARYLDLKNKNKIDSLGLITNTKLTLDVIHYARCKGINAIAWNYPSRGNLQDLIENSGMYPITILPELSREEKTRLIEDNIILTEDLLKLSDQEINNYQLVKRARLKRAIDSARLITHPA